MAGEPRCSNAFRVSALTRGLFFAVARGEALGGTPPRSVRETGLLERWREDVAVVGQSATTARVEVELWFRRDAARRAVAETTVRELITAAGGQVITQSTLTGIGYHAILADIPYSQVEAVLDRGPDAIALLTTDTIMYVSPARPMTFPSAAPSDEPVEPEVFFSVKPVDRRPRIALLDGLPMAGHIVLSERLIIDDPDQIAASYTASQMQHGTAMASLICHGDLNAPGESTQRRVYVRPIMQPHPFSGQGETVLRDRLLVDLIHEAFRRLFERHGQHDPAALSVRIVNLSIGDPPIQMFVRRISPP